MFIINNILQWWTLESVPQQHVIKPNVVKEALQWRSERQTQVQNFANQTELTCELNVQCNSPFVERHFHTKNN